MFELRGLECEELSPRRDDLWVALPPPESLGYRLMVSIRWRPSSETPPIVRAKHTFQADSTSLPVPIHATAEVAKETGRFTWAYLLSPHELEGIRYSPLQNFRIGETTISKYLSFTVVGSYMVYPACIAVLCRGLWSVGRVGRRRLGGVGTC